MQGGYGTGIWIVDFLIYLSAIFIPLALGFKWLTRNTPRAVYQTVEQEIGLDRITFVDRGIKFDISRSAPIMKRLEKRREREVSHSFGHPKTSEASYLHVVMQDRLTNMPFYVQIYRPASTGLAKIENKEEIAARITAKRAIWNEYDLLEIVGLHRPEKVANLELSKMTFIDKLRPDDLVAMSKISHSGENG